MKIKNSANHGIDMPMTLKEVEDFIKMIEMYDRNESYVSYSFIKDAFNEIIRLPVPQFSVDIGKLFIRGRVHTNNEEYFNSISQINYHPDPIIIKDFGRANEPRQSIFYCSDSETTSFIETCSITREEKDKDFELITWGTWKVIKPFHITYVIADDRNSGKNKVHEMMTNKFHEFLSKQPKVMTEPIVAFHNYLSKKFQLKALRHADRYKITAAYANWIFNQEFYAHWDTTRKAETISALMYSSSLWPDEGMNLALKPNVVDNCLKLIDVRRDRIIRKGDLYNGSDTTYAKKINVDTGTIEW